MYSIAPFQQAATLLNGHELYADGLNPHAIMDANIYNRAGTRLVSNVTGPNGYC